MHWCSDPVCPFCNRIRKIYAAEGVALKNTTVVIGSNPITGKQTIRAHIFRHSKSGGYAITVKGVTYMVVFDESDQEWVVRY